MFLAHTSAKPEPEMLTSALSVSNPRAFIVPEPEIEAFISGAFPYAETVPEPEIYRFIFCTVRGPAVIEPDPERLNNNSSDGWLKSEIKPLSDPAAFKRFKAGIVIKSFCSVLSG